MNERSSTTTASHIDHESGHQTANSWAARPWASRTIRLAVAIVPILSSVLITRTVGQAWARPSDLAGSALWFAAMIAVALVAVAAVDNVARRVLPLAALMQLTLIFPDEAPSRFTIAMRSGTTRQLERKLNNLEDGSHSPTEASMLLLELVSALRTHDRLTRGHSERVRAYSDLVANEMGLSADMRSKLHWSGLLHDIGKLRVPSEILNKKGRPTEEEWIILKSHPEEGAKLAAPLKGFLGEAFAAIEQHHERWDGAGYPAGLAGEQISEAARIVSVVDTYDVMTSVRSYKPARDAKDARAELAACSGTQFDPAAVRAFLNISLGRLRLVMGPLSWLAQGSIGGFAQAPVQTVISSGQAATTASVLAAGAISAPGMVDMAQIDAPSQSTTAEVLSDTHVAIEDVPVELTGHISTPKVAPSALSVGEPRSVEQSAGQPDGSDDTDVEDPSAEDPGDANTDGDETAPAITTTLPPVLPASTTIAPTSTTIPSAPISGPSAAIEAATVAANQAVVAKSAAVDAADEAAEAAAEAQGAALQTSEAFAEALGAGPLDLVDALNDVIEEAEEAAGEAADAATYAAEAAQAAADAQQAADDAAAAAASAPGSAEAAAQAAAAQASANVAAQSAASAAASVANAQASAAEAAGFAAQAEALLP